MVDPVVTAKRVVMISNQRLNLSLGLFDDKWQPPLKLILSQANQLGMHRITTIAMGFFLIFLGIQLNVVERYRMTPRTANFLSADGVGAVQVPQLVTAPQAATQSPYYQASYQAPAPAITRSADSRDLRPPRWLCWPVLFFGAVVLINGAALRHD